MTPIAAVEKRAKVEHAKDVKEGIPFVKVQGSIKRRRPQPSVIPSKKLKPTTTYQNPKTKSSTPARQHKKSGNRKKSHLRHSEEYQTRKRQSRT